MDAHSSHTTPRMDIDEGFLRDWFEFGMSELNAYLSRHARFDAYCERRERDAG